METRYQKYKDKTWYKEKQERYYKSKNSKFYRYKKNAIDRNLSWELSFEEFCNFWGKPCIYCGDTIETVGIDRADNNIGYIKGNLVPCCKNCNRFKLNRSGEQFVSHCKKVAQKCPLFL